MGVYLLKSDAYTIEKNDFDKYLVYMKLSPFCVAYTKFDKENDGLL